MATAPTPPTPRAYMLAGSQLYNGAVDSEGGIWLRVRDENDRRIGQSAIEKQLKNQQAAIGTLTALDPSAAHMIDYIAAALERIKSGFVGARPAGSQLDGTPIGEAMKEGKERASGNTTGGKAARGGKGTRGGDPKPVGEIVAASTTAAELGAGVQWADTVPTPRPKAGDTLRTPEGHASSIVTPIGFDVEKGAFRIVDADGWDGFVCASPVDGEWRLMTRLLDYTADPIDPIDTSDTIESGVDNLVDGDELSDADRSAEELEADAAHAAAEAGDGVEQTGGEDDVPEPYAATAAAKSARAATRTSPQRERNARAAGVSRAVPTTPVAKKPAKKTADAKKPGSKKRR